MSQPDMEYRLRALQANVLYHEETLDQKRIARDTEIAKARETGLSMYRIAQVIGISQQAVAQIVKANS